MSLSLVITKNGSSLCIIKVQPVKAVYFNQVMAGIKTIQLLSFHQGYMLKEVWCEVLWPARLTERNKALVAIHEKCAANITVQKPGRNYVLYFLNIAMSREPDWN